MSDILAKLSAEARRQRVARILPPPDQGELPFDLIRQVRADFARFLAENNLSQGAVSRQLGHGFSVPTISKFASLDKRDEYVGDADRIARGINQFMETFARRQEAPRPAGWVETEVARKMLSVIAKSIELSCIGLIYSDAGRGKTMTLEAAHSIYPGSILIRVTQFARTETGLARTLSDRLKIRGGKTGYILQSRLVEMLNGSNRPIFVDEAQRLTTGALEFLRDLHDTCKVPLILAGTRKINDVCTDTDEFFGQISSRIGLRYDVTESIRLAGSGGRGPAKAAKPLHSAAEIRKLFESEKIRFTDDGIGMLVRLGNVLGQGGLRLCRQVVYVAQGIASGKPIDAPTLLRVLRSMHSVEHAVGQIERSIEHQQLAAG